MAHSGGAGPGNQVSWFPGHCYPKHQATEFQSPNPASGFADTVDNLP